MPSDVAIGRDMAAQLTAKYGGQIKEVKFTYDPYVEFDKLDPSNPYCVVTLNTFDDVRETRTHWRETCQLMLTLVSHVGPTDSEQWIDQWLESWDLMMREARDLVMLGKHKVVGVERDDRFNADVFHNHHRLVTQAGFNFGNVR